MQVKSLYGNYSLSFESEIVTNYDCYLIDKKVLSLHSKFLSKIEKNKIIVIEAIEENKSYTKCHDYLIQLVEKGVRRGNTICAIGGGIVQDIAGFISSIIYRGVNWVFYPTTLLSQCDSCIGGKTSINLNKFKNLVGNFNPPKHIKVCTKFLDTLSEDEIQSGLGEIIKVSLIDSQSRIEISKIKEAIISSDVPEELIKKSLQIKKEIIEIDEFDMGLRNVMNYGHTFGHAIESLTKYKIPHGIAVGIGVAIANHISRLDNKNLEIDFSSIDNEFLLKNRKYVDLFCSSFDLEEYLEALSRDKKNIDNDNIVCILPENRGTIKKCIVSKERLRRLLVHVIEEINVN